MVLVWYHVAADALAIAESEPHRCFRRHMRRCAQRGRGAAPELWGESRACGLALCGFCRGGVHLIFVEEGLSIFCRRVRTTRKGCRAGCGGDGFWRRSAEAGAGRYCCCCCARRTRAALDLGNAAAGETGKDCLLFAGQSGVYCKGCVFFIMLPKDYVLIWWITDGKVRK